MAGFQNVNKSKIFISFHSLKEFQNIAITRNVHPIKTANNAAAYARIDFNGAASLNVSMSSQYRKGVSIFLKRLSNSTLIGLEINMNCRA
jgi:hypothetical protein